MNKKAFLTTDDEFNKALISYGAYIENGIVHLTCWCDSTIAFLSEMIQILEILNCKNIQHEGKVDESKNSPYNYMFHVWGNYE